MKVWLPGAAGMLGQCIRDGLEQRQLEVLMPSEQELDLTDANAVANFADTHRPSHIINCAAYTDVDGAEANEELCMAANASLVGHLAQAAAAHKAIMMHVSTDYVFDGTGSVPYSEQDPCRPMGVYGRSKWQGEQALLKVLGESDLPHYIVRTSWLFAPHGKNFVATMIRLMKERESLGVVGDQYGKPTYAPDLTTAMLYLLGLYAAPPAPAGIYHVANEQPTSWHGFAEAIREGMLQRGADVRCKEVRSITTDEYPTPAKRPAYSALATEKIVGRGFRIRPWPSALDACLEKLVGPA